MSQEAAPLTVIPAVDILGGRCVRLTQGSYNEVRDYGEDPVAVARRFAEAGARRLHVVDLDGADGRGEVNRRVIEEIRREIGITLEVGGGIREEARVEQLLAIGVDRLIVGTLLARESERFARWVDSYGPRFVAGIDARGGEVRVAGWREGTALDAVDLAVTAAGLGAVSIIYTNISRDGMLEGPDIEGTNRLARAAGIPVILSGGVSSVEDLRRLSQNRDRGVVAAIAGKAIYEGRLEPGSLFSEFPGATGEVNW
ncbi:MAG: 1-(5-phosphoribosyl)-5-[(5-phosphoribosylamino)methylideneamino]imidazole-4-carboxamide isomerase [Spirochaetaceae bacterium]